MAINSFVFWIIFPLIFLIYWIIPKSMPIVRKWFLIILSFFLYMLWKPTFAIVLLYVIIVTFYGAIWIHKSSTEGYRKRLIIILSIIALGPLVIFKYYNFINLNLTCLLSYIGLNFRLQGLNWVIPIGLSFFTFQALGYLLDVYRRVEDPEYSFSDYCLFCSFFPQISSGPISTASELLPQIKNEKEFTIQSALQGLKWVLWGIFLKCMVADRLGLYVDTVMSNYQHFSSTNCLWAAILYSLQIYGDFAGYSLMAIGIAKTLGFDLINNFNRPYFAESVSSFWRRWHISLTRWLTSHIYIPLGGSKKGKTRQYSNIMTTFLVSGIWHGANFTFIIWGCIHGIFQIIEKACGLDPKGRYANKPWLLRTKPLRIIFTFAVVTFAWIFFRMPTIGQAIDFIMHIFTDHSSQQFMYKASNSDKVLTFFSIFLLFIAELRAEYLKEKTLWLSKSWVRWVAYVALFCIILCMGVLDSGNFIYANF